MDEIVVILYKLYYILLVNREVQITLYQSFANVAKPNAINTYNDIIALIIIYKICNYFDCKNGMLLELLMIR
jgi:hypothetical protein